MALFTVPSHALKALNLRRRNASRLARIRRADLSVARGLERPLNPKRVLVTAVAEGLGDSHYVTGLCRRLSEEGLKVGVAVPPEQVSRYQGVPFIEFAAALGGDALTRAAAFRPDVVLDLEHAGFALFDERAQLIRTLGAYTVGTHPLTRDFRLWDAVLPVWEKGALGERLAVVLSHVTGKEEPFVMPVPFVSHGDDLAADEVLVGAGLTGMSFVYLNGAARDADRCFSFVQMKALAAEVLALEGVGLLVHGSEADTHRLEETFGRERVHVLQNVSFRVMCAVVKRAALAVTPDTSVTHVASAFGVPVMTVYAPNDRDVFREWAQRDVWPPLSPVSRLWYEDDPALAIDRFGYATKPAGEIRSYAPERLAAALKDFFPKVFSGKGPR